jgi:hypothetical protein
MITSFHDAFEACIAQQTLTMEEKKYLAESPALLDDIEIYYVGSIAGSADEDRRLLFNWYIGAMFNTCLKDIL